ncbi:MAG: bifunctional GNAT family N-acetyltransferase/carbon-nitrogen hydrolase family protein [Saprospiraceae bacterium]|nr:bifunctional GNAT family N-acetyltransferase/carbon-nitrogen hydrolase family protein [Saprospiraceae bacterium]
MDIVNIRPLLLTDYDGLKACMIRAYPQMPEAYWKEPQINRLLSIFPEGQLVVTINEQIVGCALSIIVRYDRFGDNHTYREITGNFTFVTHESGGDTLYGIDVFIDPTFRGQRLGRRLYDARKELCEQLNLSGIVFGGRIPNYHEHADVLSPRAYIEKVKNKELHDPTLNFQLSNDFHVSKVLRGYLPGDEESKEFATLLRWDNIYHIPVKSAKSTITKLVVRLGLVQWQMRPYRSVDELFEHMEYFVDAVSSYRCDFALFPEFFNAPLMAQYNDRPEGEAIRLLAEHTETIRDKFAKLAVSYNINIISGSMPLLRDGQLFNVGYLCRRDGSVEIYEKLHVTPDEVKCWGLKGGNTLRTFDTDCGKIGILICYDVEFPELPRRLAEEGMNILFVPFLTDTQNAFSRVQLCARARAIENECFVAIAGSVGNLPKVHNMDIQYAQSAVFTPCDFAFPVNGIKAEATPNTEMLVVADVDLELLIDLRHSGSVRNQKDRRTDLYKIDFKLENPKQTNLSTVVPVLDDNLA